MRRRIVVYYNIRKRHAEYYIVTLKLELGRRMKNKENWKPSKYVWKKSKLIASRDKKQVGVGSRLMADIIAGYYEKYLPKYAHGRLLDLGCG